MSDPQQPDLFPVGRKSRTKVRKPKGRDRIFDGLVDACGYRADRLNENDRGKLNAAWACLVDSGVANTQAGYVLIMKVAKAYRADKKLCEHMVAGWPSPGSLATNWHALVQQVKPRRSDGDRVDSAICREITAQQGGGQMGRDPTWFRKRKAIAQEIVERQPDKAEEAWLALQKKKPVGMTKSSTLQQWLGVVADMISPGELARRMKTSDEPR